MERNETGEEGKQIKKSVSEAGVLRNEETIPKKNTTRNFLSSRSGTVNTVKTATREEGARQLPSVSPPWAKRCTRPWCSFRRKLL